MLLPDGVNMLFVTSLSPLNGVVARLDADPRTFRPLLPNVQLAQSLDVTLTDFFVYTFTGGEPTGTYAAIASSPRRAPLMMGALTRATSW